MFTLTPFSSAVLPLATLEAPSSLSVKFMLASFANVSSLFESRLAFTAMGLASGGATEFFNVMFRGDSLCCGLAGLLKVNLLTSSLARSTAERGEEDLGGVGANKGERWVGEGVLLMRGGGSLGGERGRGDAAGSISESSFCCCSIGT